MNGWLRLSQFYNKKESEAIRVTAKGLAVLLDNGAIAAHEITPTKFDFEQVKHDLLVTDIRMTIRVGANTRFKVLFE